MPPIAMPEADQRPRLAARVPIPRRAPEAAAPPVAPAPGAAAEPEAPTRRRRPSVGRRLPHPPGRRAPLWLAALVAGALVTAGPTVFDDREKLPVDASAYGWGTGVDPSGDMSDAGARRGITEAEARARLSELVASRAAREPKAMLPLSAYRLTTCFCTRWGQFHPGWDMAAPLGTPIYSAIDGVVIDAGPASGFGNAVYIEDEEGNVHIYGHMRYYSVEPGQIVRAGDQIAVVGNEGFSTGPHVHWQIQKGGRNGPAIDPADWLADHDVKA